MSLPLPNLDDRTYADLLEELRARIPSLCPEWTDHNPSDPGITFLELFTWLTEMLLYRVNRVSDETTRTFLRLLNGQEPKPGLELAEQVRTLVLDLRSPYRAVTAADYEALALEVNGVARARCVPRRNLEAPTPAMRAEPKPGWVSLIVVPQAEPAGPQQWAELLGRVKAYLEPRRLLTVRHAVIAPLYAPVAVTASIVRRLDAGPLLLEAAERAIRSFLDPLTGGPEGEGWPFGRDVYVSEIYQALEAVPGLDYVTEIKLSSPAGGTGSQLEQGTEILHSGDQVGLKLGSDLLPRVTNVTVKEA
jgi:Baseplate J-like protein